jgi:2-oxoglutarate dehydrogenase E2 component (dihydrolipoamide succinyltransferase)
MPVPVTMPQLGESVTEGTVTRWLKNVGDTIALDEPLLEVSTDKVDTEIPSPVAGVLLKISANEDDTVEVGGELAIVGEAGESAGDAAPAAEAAAPAAAAEAPAPTPEPAAAPPAAEPAPAAPAAAPAAAASGDATPVLLPALGESVTEGTVTRWLKNVGDDVALDEPLLEVSTDKVDTEIPSPVAGTLLEISVAEDGVVEVGGQLALIGAAGASPAAAAPAPTPEPVAAAPAPAPTPAAAPTPPPAPAPAPTPAPEAAAPAAPATPAPSAATAPGGAASDAYVTPLVRKLASDNGIDLATVSGSGVGGRIRKQDVQAAIDAKKAAAAPAPASAPSSSPAAAPTARPTAASPLRGKTEKMSRLRKVIAERMVESLQVSAQLTTVVEVDVTRIANLRERAKADFAKREGVKLSFLPFFARAAIDALKQYPSLNASIDTEAGTVTYYDAEHLGMAVDTERGLLVPVIKDAGNLNIPGLAKQISDLAERTRENRVGPDELSGGTFTLTNTGSRGALFDTPIINQPQVGILGTGAVVKRPMVVKDEFGSESIAIRSMVYLALTYDHRLVDGAEAARFLVAVKGRLEEGDFAAELGL